MEINNDCIRDILKYCVKNIDYIEYSVNSWREKSVSLHQLYSDEKLKKYEKKVIMYSVKKLYENNFIVVNNITPTGKEKEYIENCYIVDVTIDGHNFYNSIKDDTVWNKTKNIISRAGNHTLKFIEDTAQMVAVASAKQMVTVMMTKN
nr:MAG TPA: Flagellin, PadR, transcription factor, DNA.8A [Bacteriophage sp.]